MRTLISPASICGLPSVRCLCFDRASACERVKRRKQETETKVQKDEGDGETERDRDREKESEEPAFDVWEVSYSIRDP